MGDQPIIVNIRWHDGYRERFECSEVRSGAQRLWLMQTDGHDRSIPLMGNVRWVSVDPYDRAEYEK